MTQRNGEPQTTIEIGLEGIKNAKEVSQTIPDGELRKLFFDWFQEVVDQIEGDVLREEMYAALSRAEFLPKIEEAMQNA